MKNIHYLCLLGLILVGSISHAQVSEENIVEERNENEVEDDTKLFHFNLQLKNMHLWKGLHVTDAPMTAADINYTSRNGFFKAGLWGGRGFDGDYTEFDYYVSFMHKGWSLSIWDINNYSDYPDAKIFDYDRSTTSHFIDVILAYQFQKVPLKLSWSTIVQGRDTYLNDDGQLRNAYSNYVEASYVILNESNWSLSGLVGGSWSFAPQDAHFYGDEAGITNIGVIYNRELNVFDKFTLPVSATASWNPVQDYGAIQVAFNLF
ncbi:hypothetical protein [Zunongwangia pacifica]|uniref:MetA-pathway of phenol degradation n=1 Tax=Zunongwangia pacifica TaxID=2911062 RepID=A0A9X1ZT87_9FLAO|nr:hypothetical protein [Zunongwangia pacifica]MCL6219726.1 hypothetical protein [Zunongwangia pacifica]